MKVVICFNMALLLLVIYTDWLRSLRAPYLPFPDQSFPGAKQKYNSSLGSKYLKNCELCKQIYHGKSNLSEMFFKIGVLKKPEGLQLY